MFTKRFLVVAALTAIMLLVFSSTAGAMHFRHTFFANLSGGEEVPASGSLARGMAIFQLSADGSALSYRLSVANLEDTRVSHIHLAPAGANGGVVVTLYGPELIEGRFSGVLAVGTITAANLSGALAGMPLSALVAELEAGNAYVNVHTLAFPGGEIRGQIR